MGCVECCVDSSALSAEHMSPKVVFKGWHPLPPIARVPSTLSSGQQSRKLHSHVFPQFSSLRELAMDNGHGYGYGYICTYSRTYRITLSLRHISPDGCIAVAVAHRPARRREHACAYVYILCLQSYKPILRRNHHLNNNHPVTHPMISAWYYNNQISSYLTPTSNP